MAGGVNLYAYAGNNPVSFSDPFGLFECVQQGNCTQGEVGKVGARNNKSLADIRADMKADGSVNELPYVIAAATISVSAPTTAMGRVAAVLVPRAGTALGRLVGKPNPTKLNRAGDQQPFNARNGQYLAPSANPGLRNSPVGDFGIGFGQGYASGITGAVAPDATSAAMGWGQTVGQFVGVLFDGN